MNILLLEPNYKNKYPPLGLMKIARFHKNINDNVEFAKGINNNLIDKHWDRIYINSLFTFEWSATQKMIKFAYLLVKDKKSIYLGGIAATLMPEFISKAEPEINIIQGLLNKPGLLNLPNDHTIDTLPPDYSILEQIEYKYPVNDAYFTYTTRGCGMNCSFCAVQRLEPEYVGYIDIHEQIKIIKENYGEKRHLMLMDNNVLKSPNLSTIVDDIISLGFGADATFINPKTKKSVKRYVDFNQGLDANFLTEEKAFLLSRLALKPVRIAFDHINQRDKYEKAIRKCFNAGLRSFSNYLLYNSDEASWKGKAYHADTPEDLYFRLEYNVSLCENLQNELRNAGIEEKVEIYSFPMRYIPLHDTKRGYIGTNWNKKYLRAIQVFLNPTQGKGVSSKNFFKAAFGSNVNEFKLALLMPENIIIRRGEYHPKVKDSEEDREKKLRKSLFNKNLLNEWKNLHQQLVNENLWDSFVSKYVLNNVFTFETFSKIKNSIEKRMYLYYIPPQKINNNFSKLNEDTQLFLKTFVTSEKNYLSKILNINH